MTSTKPPSGTRDFLPADVRRREHVIGVIRAVYERYGFEPLETPAFENIETLLGKYGEEGNKLIFKILRRGEHEASGVADLALRYDLTVPLARVVAQYQHEIPKFFKRYQIQPVWRADRPAKGRFREFYQCDVDAVGSTSPVVDAEILSAAAEVLERLGFRDFVMRLNHRRVLSSLLEAGGVLPGQHESALVALDKLDKVGPDGVSAELAARGIALAPRVLSAVIAHSGDPDVSWLGGILLGRPDGLAAVAELETIRSLVGAGVGGRRIRIDATLARGLSYYTGAIMEVAVPDLAGSLGGGGRYDNLIGMFLGRNVPACGFSLGLERILVVMAERGMFPAHVERTTVEVQAAFLDTGTRDYALEVAWALRATGVRVDLCPEPVRNPGKILQEGEKRGIRFVVLLGENERDARAATVKDLGTGERRTVALADLSDELKKPPSTSEHPENP
jgi:histidyl-tRNA synthetase